MLLNIKNLRVINFNFQYFIPSILIVVVSTLRLVDFSFRIVTKVFNIFENLWSSLYKII